MVFSNLSHTHENNVVVMAITRLLFYFAILLTWSFFLRFTVFERKKRAETNQPSYRTIHEDLGFSQSNICKSCFETVVVEWKFFLFIWVRNQPPWTSMTPFPIDSFGSWSHDFCHWHRNHLKRRLAFDYQWHVWISRWIVSK